jgi:hypothetical protein
MADLAWAKGLILLIFTPQNFVFSHVIRCVQAAQKYPFSAHQCQVPAGWCLVVLSLLIKAKKPVMSGVYRSSRASNELFRLF